MDDASNGVPQFATAEFGAAVPRMTCAACHRPITGDSHATFTRALAFGVAGALAGFALYVGFALATGLVIGWVSVAVGFIVGKSMNFGSRGVGGRRYQITAALLTYVAVSMSAVPIALHQMNAHRAQTHSTETAAPAKAPMNVPRALGVLALAGIASPILDLQDPVHGLIGLVILFVGIRFAWQFTAGRALAISGPHTPSPTGVIRRRMESPIDAAPPPCARCGAALAPDALVCANCQAMVHATRLEELATSARAHEERNELAAAHDDWQAALALLPGDSSQAAWVRAKREDLFQIIRRQAAKDDAPRWTRKLGPFAPLALLLLKGKLFLSLLKLKFLLSFASFAGIYWALYGAWFGVGLAVLILIHELEHLVAVRRRGLAADLPMFIPGFGAYVRWNAAGVTPDTRALVSLAGPLAGALGAVCCALVWLRTQHGLWISLASFSAFINLLNLIPVWTLDGGQAMAAINRPGRIGIAIAAVMFAAFFSQPLILLVAGGAVYRAFEKSSTALPVNQGVTAYFIVLLATLGYLSTLAPLGAAR